MQSVFWSSRRRRLPRTEQETIWTNQKLPLMIHVLWPGFPFSFSLCSGPMRKDCCFDSAVQEVLCITWEVSDREIVWVVPKPLTRGYVFTQIIAITIHQILDWPHTYRPSLQHRSEGIQATAGQHSVGSSHTRPTRPLPESSNCYRNHPCFGVPVNDTLRRSEKNHAFHPSTMFTYGDDDRW